MVGALLSKAPARTGIAARSRSFPMACVAPRFSVLSAVGSAAELPDRRVRAVAPMRHALGACTRWRACPTCHLVAGRNWGRAKPEYPTTAANTTPASVSFRLPHVWCQPALRNMPQARNLASVAQRPFASEPAMAAIMMKICARCTNRPGEFPFFKLSGITSALPVSIPIAARPMSAAITLHVMVAGCERRRRVGH